MRLAANPGTSMGAKTAEEVTLPKADAKGTCSVGRLYFAAVSTTDARACWNGMDCGWLMVK